MTISAVANRRLLLVSAWVLSSPLAAQQPMTPELFQNRYAAEMRQCTAIHAIAIRNGCIDNSYVASRPDLQQACITEQNRRKATCEERAAFALQGALENIRRRER